MESAQALHDLERMGRSGILQTIRVVMTLPPDDDVKSSRGWSAARRVQEWLEQDERTAFVRSVVKPDGARWTARLLFLTVPDSEVRTLVSRDRRAVLFDLVPKEGVDPNALLARVRDVRRLDVARLSGVPGMRLAVGGLPGFRADYLDAVGGALPFVIVVIVIGTTLALAWGFRSVLIPLKAVLLNLCSVTAGFGALVLVFQDWQRVDQVFVAIPALVFCAVFGLSMDYEVFLVARVAEARRAGATEIDAIADALARTGPVITNAAAVMVVVFGAFALGKFLMIRMLGLALAVTVLVDATLVRVAIGPALLALAGRWNWWPGERRGVAAPSPALEVPIRTAQ